MILHLLQIFLTDDRTFILFIAEGYASFCEVVGADFHGYRVALKDSDVVDSHFSRDRCVNDVVYEMGELLISYLHSELRVRQCFDNDSLKYDIVVFAHYVGKNTEFTDKSEWILH